MQEKTRFEIVSDAAFVAGRRNPGKGKLISLTEEEARYPLIAGEIALPAVKPQTPPAGNPPGEAAGDSLGGKPSGKVK